MHYSVTKIGSYAFAECTSLEKVVWPEDIETIGSNAFEGCSGLETVFIMPEVSSWHTENMLYAEYNAFGDNCYIDTLYLGVNTYDCSSSIGLYPDNVCYLDGCDYDVESHILTGSPGEIFAFKNNNSDSFLKKIYTI